MGAGAVAGVAGAAAGAAATAGAGAVGSAARAVVPRPSKIVPRQAVRIRFFIVRLLLRLVLLLNGEFAFLFGADAHSLVNRGDEHFAISDFPSARGLDDGADGGVDLAIG